jgi:outer membrane protein OmpA-like peptidoglycan-associated protein
MRKIYAVGVLITTIMVLAHAANSQSRIMKILNPNMGQSYKCSHVGIQKIKKTKFKKKVIAALREAYSLNVIAVNNTPEGNGTSAVETELKLHKTLHIFDTLSVVAGIPLPKPVYFRFDTDELTYDDLREILLAVQHAKLGKSIQLEGHTDFMGTEIYNYHLSVKRANKIKAMMVDLGVKAEAISITGYGETKPATENGTDTQRQLNRRVEFIVMNE